MTTRPKDGVPKWMDELAKDALSAFRAMHTPQMIKTLPVLSQGQAEDLVYEDHVDGVRIWRVRVSRADGYVGSGLSVEVYDRESRWVTVIT